MTVAWYGHLKFKDISFFKNVSIVGAVLISWLIALIEYSLMVPANKLGSNLNGGPFNMWQLKIIQEVVSISVFVIFTLIFFKHESFRLNHLIGFAFLIAALYFFFRK
jgi:uncharacterized protein (DUF486 family)